MNIIDCHTHNKVASKAIINATIGSELQSNRLYSIGVHPWDSYKYSDITAYTITEYASKDNIVAIGETGIDLLKGGDFELQRNLFIKHIEASEALHKPIILHVVKAWQHIIALQKELNPTQAWIAHGFRGKPELAMELVKHGIYISLGEKFNHDTAKAIPFNFLLIETDESKLTADEIIGLIAETRGTTTEQLTYTLAENLNNIL